MMPNLGLSVSVVAAFILVSLVAWGGVLAASRKKSWHVREYPLFTHAADEVGRAAEEGALVHLSLGHGSLVGHDAMTSIASLEGLAPLMAMAAAYDTPPIITTGDPTLYLLADDWMRRAYTQVGNVERYRPLLVQFNAAAPLPYAAWAATYTLDAEKGGAQVMVGAFDQEVSLIADAAVRKDFYLMGGAVSPVAIAALYPTTPVQTLAIGEDLFTGAVRVKEGGGEALILVEEVLRWLLVLIIIGVALLSLFGIELGGG